MGGKDCPMCASIGMGDNDLTIAVADLPFSEVRLERRSRLAGYCIVVWKDGHVAEPTDLEAAAAAGYWRDVIEVGRGIRDCFEPMKLNFGAEGVEADLPRVAAGRSAFHFGTDTKGDIGGLEYHAPGRVLGVVVQKLDQRAGLILQALVLSLVIAVYVGVAHGSTKAHGQGAQPARVPAGKRPYRRAAGDLSRARVTFLIYQVADCPLAHPIQVGPLSPGPPSPDGSVMFNALRSIRVGVYSVRAVITGNNRYFQGASDFGMLTVARQLPGPRADGAGTVTDPAVVGEIQTTLATDTSASFALSAKGNATPTGTALYRHDRGQRRWNRTARQLRPHRADTASNLWHQAGTAATPLAVLPDSIIVTPKV
jgi:hypothetical protein